MLIGIALGKGQVLPSESSSPPSEEIFVVIGANFVKITSENNIFGHFKGIQEFQAPLSDDFWCHLWLFSSFFHAGKS